MIMADEKPHISPSQLETFARCPEAWRRRYVEGEIIPPGIAQLQGTAVHVGAAVNFKQKIDSHEDLPVNDIVEIAVDAYETGIKGGYQLSPDEDGGGYLRVAKKQVARVAELHATKVAPDYQPLLVEERVNIALPKATHDLVGVVDLVARDSKTAGLWVVDHKTSTVRRRQDEADNSIQLTYYHAAAVQRKHGQVAGVRLEVLIKPSPGTPYAQRQQLHSQRGAADYSVLAARINAMLAAVAAGIFPPASPGAWWCSPKFCGYHSTCPYVRSTGPTLVQIKPPAAATTPTGKPRKLGALSRLLESAPYCRDCNKRLTRHTAVLVPEGDDLSCKKCAEAKAKVKPAPTPKRRRRKLVPHE